MTLLGRLLRDRKAGDTHAAWNLPNLQGPDRMTLTSRDFEPAGSLPIAHCARNIGGQNLSPHLSWSPPPSGTAQLLLVLEDIDVPLKRPAVHTVALIDPAAGQLAQGALAKDRPAPEVRLLRSLIGRGYHGPAPIKGHGEHRYIFQLFALASPLGSERHRDRPRTLLSGVTVPVLGRGRLTAIYER